MNSEVGPQIKVFEEESVTISNIYNSAVVDIVFKQSETEPTNQDVLVSIEYPDDATVKEYKEGITGTWITYTEPVRLLENGTIFARTQDIEDSFAEEASFVVMNIDKNPPSVLFDELSEGAIFINEVTPTIRVIDNLSSVDTLVKTITLNGVDYKLGTPITSPGTHLLVVNVQDQAGNLTVESVTFSLKKELEVIGSIPPISVSKFGEAFVELEHLFSDLTGGTVKYEAVIDNENIANTIINDSRLTILGVKQGSTNINVRIKNENVQSEYLPIEFTVSNTLPEITLDEDTWSLVSEDQNLVITGLVKDKDKDDQTIIGSLGDLSESTFVHATDEESVPWKLTFNMNKLPPGIYGPLVVQTTDAFGGTDSITHTKPVIKVPGDTNLFNSAVKSYEDDLSEAANTWTKQTYRTLFEAYMAIRAFESDDRKENQDAAVDAVDALQSGALKTEYEKRIEIKIFDGFKQNLSTATENDYAYVGIAGVNDDNLMEVRKWSILHLADIGDTSFQKKHIHEMIMMANHVLSADGGVAISVWLTVHSYGNRFGASVKEEAARIVHAKILEALAADPASLTLELLMSYFSIAAHVDYLADYQEYLTDIAVANGNPIELDDVTGMVTVVNETNALQHAVQVEPSSEAMIEYMKHVDSIIDGGFKSKKKDFYYSVLQLLHFVTYPMEQTVSDYAKLGVTAIEEHISQYQNNLTKYITDIGVENMAVSMIQDVINLTDSLLAYKEGPNNEPLLEEVYTAIEELKEGRLKKSLSLDLEDIALDFIGDHPDSFEERDLLLANLLDVNGDLLDDYRLAVGDVYPVLLPATFIDIQSWIKIVNQLDVAYHSIGVDPRRDKILDFQDIVKGLPAGQLKEKYLAILPVVALSHLTRYPEEVTADSLALAEVVFNKDNVLTYQYYLKAYKNNVTDFTKEVLDTFTTVLDGFILAINEPAPLKVIDAVTSIETLADGKLKSMLLEELSTRMLEWSNKGNGKESGSGHENLDISKTQLIINEKAPISENLYHLQNVDAITEQGKDSIKFVNITANENLEMTIASAIKRDNSLQGPSDTVSMAAEYIMQPAIEQDIDGPPCIEPYDECNTLTTQDVTSTPSEVAPGRNTGIVVPTDGKPLEIEGTVTENGYEFIIAEEVMADIINNNTERIILLKDDLVSIEIPFEAIDFQGLQSKLDNFGLVVRLIKGNEGNIKLVVKAFTDSSECEITTFSSHLKVVFKEEWAMEGGENPYLLQPKGSDKKTKSFILREEGDNITAVPHIYADNIFTIQTRHTGYFIVQKQDLTFDDIENIYCKADIEELVSRRIIFGTTENKYSPNAKVSHAQLAAIIARALDLLPTRETSFNNVKGKWYEDDVQALCEAGIIQGSSGATFNANGFVFHQQLATMMNRVLIFAGVNVEINDIDLSYSDQREINEIAYEDVKVLKHLGIMTGDENDCFNPQAVLTRAPMAKVLSATLKKAMFI